MEGDASRPPAKARTDPAGWFHHKRPGVGIQDRLHPKANRYLLITMTDR